MHADLPLLQNSKQHIVIEATFYIPATREDLPGPADTFQGPTAGLTIETLPSSYFSFSRDQSINEELSNSPGSTLISWHSKQRNADGTWSVWRLSATP